MKIEIIKCLQDNYSYLIIDEENQTACVIDPSESAPIINYLDNSKINLKFILNTHHHYLEDNQIWKQDNFEAKIYHVPGHTSGHIAFHFFKEKKIFTGDTLFSLGCGRIFEGTYEQMYNSLKKIKSLPKDTEIYCGHEYTLQNSNFCIANDSGNLKLKNKILEINKKLKNALPTIPSTLADELECNIFLKAKDLESFSKLRDLKDNF